MSEWSHDYWTDLAETEAVGMPAEPPVIYRVPRAGHLQLKARRTKLQRERVARLAREFVGLE